MQFVDTHCHLYYKSYQEDIQEVVNRSVAAGVERIIVPGLDLATSHAAIALAERFEGVFAAVGVHPGDVHSFQSSDLDAFKAFLEHPKVVAVGEIGLDYYHRIDNKNLQTDVLVQFLQIARDFNKPVILHSRESLTDLLIVLQHYLQEKDYRELTGVFHSFEGNLQDANKIIDLGFYLGVGGPLTYKNSSKKHGLFSKIDLTRVLLETDGPFLPPQKYRGQRNEPAYIPLIAEKVAELQLCDIKDVATQTTRNVEKLFSLDQTS